MNLMLVRFFAARRGSCRSFTLLLLLLLVGTLCAQASHFHFQTHTESPGHCTLCEVSQTPLPPLLASALVISHSLSVFDQFAVFKVFQCAQEASNLFVRPPPFRNE
jgi:hypothetical protein